MVPLAALLNARHNAQQFDPNNQEQKEKVQYTIGYKQLHHKVALSLDVS